MVNVKKCLINVIENNRIDIMKLFVKYNFTIYFERDLPIQLALSLGRIEIVKLLLQHPSVNVLKEIESTPFLLDIIDIEQ